MTLPVLAPPSVLRWATAPIMMHGASDIFEHGWPRAYLFAMLVPERAIHIVSFGASVVHFSDDVGGVLASVMMHALLWVTCWRWGVRAASALLYTFMTLFHVPRHLRALRATPRQFVVVLSAIGACVARPDHIHVWPWMQRVVIGHCVHTVANSRVKR